MSYPAQVEGLGKYGLLYISSVYGIECFGEIYKQKYFALRFFLCTPSMIQQIVRTHKVLIQFLWKLF